jgi:hypothetical protein
MPKRPLSSRPLVRRAGVRLAFLLLAAHSALSACARYEDEEEGPSPQVQPKPNESVPPLPQEKLPPRTREKPDPEGLQFRREAVHVRVDARVAPSSGPVGPPSTPVFEEHIKEYLRRFGHPVTDRAEEATYIVEGTFEAAWKSDVVFQRRTIAYEVKGSSTLRVLTREGEEIDAFEVPETLRVNVVSEESGFVDLGRYTAKLQWENLSRRSKRLARPQVVQLLEHLVVVDPGGETETGAVPESADVAVKRLADLGLEAVPYLIEALTDTRPVSLPSTYPGLEEQGAAGLKVYHVADKALEEIFQKVSRMGLTTTDEQRFVIIRGWENEWRRFCPSYRESPRAPRAPARNAGNVGSSGNSDKR